MFFWALSFCRLIHCLHLVRIKIQVWKYFMNALGQKLDGIVFFVSNVQKLI